MGKGGKQNREGQEAMRRGSFGIQTQPDLMGSGGVRGGGSGLGKLIVTNASVLVRLNFLGICA